jgi:hypothetical protein
MCVCVCVCLCVYVCICICMHAYTAHHTTHHTTQRTPHTTPHTTHHTPHTPHITPHTTHHTPHTTHTQHTADGRHDWAPMGPDRLGHSAPEWPSACVLFTAIPHLVADNTWLYDGQVLSATKCGIAVNSTQALGHSGAEWPRRSGSLGAQACRPSAGHNHHVRPISSSSRNDLRSRSRRPFWCRMAEGIPELLTDSEAQDTGRILHIVYIVY